MTFFSSSRTRSIDLYVTNSVFSSFSLARSTQICVIDGQWHVSKYMLPVYFIKLTTGPLTPIRVFNWHCIPVYLWVTERPLLPTSSARFHFGGRGCRSLVMA
jgi:hypothetical protein